MDARILYVLAFFFLVVFIVCWLVLSPIFASFGSLEPNVSYRLAVVVLVVTPISLAAFLGLIVYVKGHE